MSADDDVAVVQANSRAFSACDIDTMLGYYAPDAVVEDLRRVSLGTFRGHDELRAYYLSIFHSAAALEERLEVVATGDGVVVARCELWGRLASDPGGSGITIDYGLVLHLRDGLIQRLLLCEDGEHALEVSGLEP